MTAYFDEWDHALGEWRRGDRADWRFPVGHEQRLVWDCVLAVEVDPAFPADLRDRCHRIILKYAVYTLPVNAPPKDFETDDEGIRLMQMLSQEMHTLFHDIARDDRTDYYDNPKGPLMALFARGEERQEQMVAEALLPDEPQPKENDHE